MAVLTVGADDSGRDACRKSPDFVGDGRGLRRYFSTYTMRIQTKIGDIYSVNVSPSERRYFQYITNDLTQLNSDVIAAFKRAYSISATPDITTIVQDQVDFHAHCILKVGLKQGFWDKAGNSPVVGDYGHVVFRDTGDVGKPGIKISENWWVWKINQPQIRVGRLEGENTRAEIGLVFNPENIVHRLQTGVYSQGGYPGG